MIKKIKPQIIEVFSGLAIDRSRDQVVVFMVNYDHVERDFCLGIKFRGPIQQTEVVPSLAARFFIFHNDSIGLRDGPWRR